MGKRIQKSEITILAIGLALPFIGNLLGAILYGMRLLYFLHAGLTTLFVLEAIHLIPVISCIVYYKASTGLKRFRYVPIVVTYGYF
jgi:hypothetical protein